MSGRWVDIQEAASVLGISTEAVRKRVQRGKLQSERRDDRLHVWLDDVGTESEPGQAGREAHPDVVDVLRDEVAHLRRESERKDAIIMQLSQANTEQARAIRAIEAPYQTAQEAAHGPAEAEEGRGPGPAREDAEKGAQRPWWRRVFGG